MNTWIFQGNPARFRVNNYLEDNYKKGKDILWLVSRYYEEIKPGDRVYIWRSIGNGDQSSGIVASGKILTEPEVMVTPHFVKEYWIKPSDKKTENRAWVSIEELRLNNGMLKREDLRKIEELKEMQIFKFFARSNYGVTANENEIIEELWKLKG